MAETATEPTKPTNPQYSIKALIGDANFEALPMADKEAIFASRVKADKEFQERVPDETERRSVFEAILQENTRRRLTTSGQAQGDQRTQGNWRVSLEDPGAPTQAAQGIPLTPESDANIPDTIMRGAVKAVDMIPGMIMRPAGVALEEYGRIPERLGLTEENAQNVFTKTGQFLQTHPATSPVETIVTGGKGFKELPPGYAALEHIISSTLGTIVPATITAKLYPLLRSGEIVPAVDQVKKAVYLAGQGATLGQVAKLLGSPEWASFVIEGITGLADPSDIGKIIKTVRESPGLSRYIRQEHDRILTYKAEEAFGGPKLKERYEGGTTTLKKQQGKLTDFVSSEAAKVTDAQRLTVEATGRKGAIEDQSRLLSLESKVKARAADEIASEKIAGIEVQKKQLDDELAQKRDDFSAGFRERRAEMTRQRQALDEQHKDALREAQTNHIVVQEQAQAINTRALQDKAALEDNLAHITAANERDINAAQDFARKNAQSISPDLARGRTLSEVARIGKALVNTAGEGVQTFYERVAARLKTNAEREYGNLFRKYQISEDAEPLRQAMERFKASDVPATTASPTSGPAGSIPTQQVRGTYAPRSVVDDFNTKLVQLAGEQGLDPSSELHLVQMGLEDVQNFRSRLLEDLTNTPKTSPRYRYVSDVFQEFSAHFDSMAKSNPAAFEELAAVNGWYRTEIRRLTGGPGYTSRVRNPFTKEYMQTPDEVARGVFGPGTTVGKGGAQAAQRERAFNMYLRDLDETIVDASLGQTRQTGSDILMTGKDLPTIAAATQAKEALFDMARAQFYNAAMPEGVYDAVAAAKWIRDHASLLEANLELKKLFQTARDRAEAVRDVQAKSQSVAALPEAYLKDIGKVIDETKASGQAAVDASKRTLDAATREAGDALNAGRTQVSETNIQLREDVAKTNQQTRAQRVQEARDRAEELERVRKEPETVKAENERQASLQAERVRLAKEAQANMAKNEKAVIEDFEATFPGRAAERARKDAQFAESMGNTPDDIVQQIEAMGSQADKNATWAQWMKKAGNDEELKTAILQARWRNFLGGKDVITDPGKAAAFIEANKEWLKRYYPDYLTNIERVQSAFETMENLYKNSPLDFNKKSLFRHAGLSGTLVYMSHIFGFNWSEAVGLGLASEGIQHMLYRRKVGGVSQIYLNPSDLDLIAKATRVGTPINVINQAAWVILTHAGIIAQEASGEQR